MYKRQDNSCASSTWNWSHGRKKKTKIVGFLAVTEIPHAFILRGKLSLARHFEFVIQYVLGKEYDPYRLEAIDLARASDKCAFLKSVNE